MTDNFYRYIGRMKPENTKEVLEEYNFANPGHKSHAWKSVRYNDLRSTVISMLCEQSCVLLGTQDLLIKNPEIFVERHHIEITKDSSSVGRFGIHTDDDGPAGGPCQSILYYYNIDENITDSQLNFYRRSPTYFNFIPVCNNHIACSFQPVTGDVVTFHNGIWHCPGNYKTESETPVLRGVIAIFIKHHIEHKPIRQIDRCCLIM
tara:strand:+ start:179 stop:793 length:615 start_codon:yes stop_codon:yes gene_type:complete